MSVARPTLTRYAALCAAAALALTAATAGATIIDALTMEQLVARADHIVVATVVERTSLWNGHGQIATDVTLQVERSLEGDSQPGQPLVVRRIGGEVGDVGMTVAGAPRFEVGGRYLLFLERRGEHLRTVGMSQGVMPVRNGATGPIVHPGGGGLMLVRQASTGAMEAAPGALPGPLPAARVMDDLRDLIRASHGR